MIGVAVAADLATLGGASPAVLAPLVIGGVGMIVSGTATLITGDPIRHRATTERNPIAPWSINYGRVRVGGTLLYDQQWGSNNQVRDLVIALNANQSQIDFTHPITLLFDMQRVQIDTSAVAFASSAGYPVPRPNICSGTSFTPVQQTVNITSIVRSNDVVTVKVSADIPYLIAGDRILLQGVNHGISGSDQSFNGVFQVAEITNAPSSHVGGAVGPGTGLWFTVLSGGIASTGNTSAGPASAVTQWADYARNVYMEVLPGNQALGQTFVGMLAGTPWQGTGKLVTPASPQNAGGTAITNPWTAFCSAQGKTLVFLRITYAQKYFEAGLPQISFLLYGKNDIYDPRLGAYGAPNTRVYTENAALCIADFLATGAPLSPAYNPATTYAAGAVASFQGPGMTNGLDYVSFVNSNTGNEPDTHASQWTPVTSANLPQAWNSTTTYAAGTLVSLWPTASANPPAQYVSIVNSNTGNSPDSSPSQWAPLAVQVWALPDWGYRLEYGTDIPIGIKTTVSSSIGTGTQIVTPASMTGIVPNSMLLVSNADTTNAEWVTVSAVTGSTFTAVFSSSKTGSGILVSSGLIAAANICDFPVALAAGGTEPMYALSGQFQLARKRGEILQDMLTACAGRLSVVSGQYFIQPGFWAGANAPSVNLTSMASAGFKWRGISNRELFNGVKGTFISPQNKWQSTDFPYYAQDSFHGYSGPAIYGGDINLHADGGDRRWLELHLPFTISASTAQRIAKIELLRRRWANLSIGGSGTFPLNMSGYQFAPLDVIAAQVPFLWGGTKNLEIVGTRFRVDENNGRPTLGTEIDAVATDSSIYVWSTSEELSAQGYQQSQYPTGTFQEQRPFPWSPGYVAPLAGDAYYPQGATGPASFGLQPSYGIDAQGNATAAALISGVVPANVLDTGIEAPQFTCTAATTGGSLTPGDYVVAISARDSGASIPNNSKYQAIAVVAVQGSGSGSIAVSITWGSGDDGGDIFLGKWEENGYVFHHNQMLSPGQATATITALDESTYGGPDSLFDHFGIVWQQVIHGGPWAQQVQAVTATTITIAGLGMTMNQWAGRVLTLLAKYDPTVQVPVLNMPVASNTASSGTPAEFVLTIGPNADSVQLPDLTTLLAVGDLVVMRPNWTFGTNSTTGQACMTDLLVANPYYPTGANATVEPGHVAIWMTGANKGDRRTISSVTVDTNGNYTVFNFASPPAVTPANGDLVIICAASQQEIPGNGWTNANNTLTGLVASPDIGNLGGMTWLLLMRTEDVNGNYGPDSAAPMREIYFFGVQGTVTVKNSMTLLSTFRRVAFDTSGISGSTTTLAAAISSPITTPTAISTAAAVTPTGTFISIGSEIFLINSGGGTTTPTVTGGQQSTTAATHSNGATVNMGGPLTATLPPIAQVPNQGLLLQKISTDLNYVELVPDSSNPNFQDGSTTKYLTDTTPQRGFADIEAPAGHTSWWVRNAAGISLTSSGSSGSTPNPAPIVHTLTANYTVPIAAPASDGLEQLVLLTQDGTGGWTVDWTLGGLIAVTSVPQISSAAGTADPNTTTPVKLYSAGGKWYGQGIGIHL